MGIENVAFESYPLFVIFLVYLKSVTTYLLPTVYMWGGGKGGAPALGK